MHSRKIDGLPIRAALLRNR